MQIVVNLWGAPGSGKSTGATYIFSQLKLKGLNVELVTETAKDLTWEENHKALKNQFYVSGCQSYRLSRLKDKVDIIITDSPLPLGSLYINETTPKSLPNAILEEYCKYNNINFLIERDKPYNINGRLQSEDESKQLQKQLKDFMSHHNIEYMQVKGNLSGYNSIIETILTIISNEEGIDEKSKSGQ